ncbi:multicopper oxidase family protein [Paenibacillus tarimensis]
MSYGLTFGLDALMIMLLIVLWSIARSKAGRFVRSSDAAQLRRRIRGILITIGLAMLPIAGRLALLFKLQSDKGWIFTQDKWLFHLPLLLIPAAAVILFTIPRLHVLSPLASGNDRAGLDAGQRRSASDPYLVMPLHAAALGSVVSFFFMLVPPALTHWERVAWPSGVLLLTLLLLGYIQVRRQRAWSRPDAPLQRSLPQRLLRTGASVLVIAIAFGAWFVTAEAASRLPGRISMMAGVADYGGGAATTLHHTEGHEGHTSVESLTGPQTGEPDRKFTLTAEKKTIKLPSGEMMEAWTYNGQLPGPELRMRHGELIEVTLINKDIENGVTIHWHGLDVPNAEDGVAGATQNAVMPGQTHTYRFVAEQTGTYWYHSHQDSAESVKKGLFGSLIVDPTDTAATDRHDITVITHYWEDGSMTFNSSGQPIEYIQTSPGTPVRLRLINTDNWVERKFAVVGTPFRVIAIDGMDLSEPTELTDTHLQITTGGRFDVAFTMPDHPVFLSIDGKSKHGILFSQDGSRTVPPIPDTLLFDPSDYGSPKPTPFDLDSPFDREFMMVLDNMIGFYDGKFDQLYTINGDVFPNTPMYMVKEGDLVKTTIVNRGMVDHPMHLHGHHMLVLSRNGKAVSGSPWWSDTLYVAPGETYEVAFIADNPGIWMNHCHNLEHAAVGMTMHLSYEGVWSPFEIGHATVNKPE